MAVPHEGVIRARGEVIPSNLTLGVHAGHRYRGVPRDVERGDRPIRLAHKAMYPCRVRVVARDGKESLMALGKTAVLFPI